VEDERTSQERMIDTNDPNGYPNDPNDQNNSGNPDDLIHSDRSI